MSHFVWRHTQRARPAIMRSCRNRLCSVLLVCVGLSMLFALRNLLTAYFKVTTSSEAIVKPARDSFVIPTESHEGHASAEGSGPAIGHISTKSHAPTTAFIVSTSVRLTRNSASNNTQTTGVSTKQARSVSTAKPTNSTNINFSFYVQANNGKRCGPAPTLIAPNASIFTCDFRSQQPVPCNYRLRAELACNESSSSILFRWVRLDSPPVTYDYNDTCLARVVAENCTKNGLIPRVVHYVNFNRRKMEFHGLFSVLSAVRFVRPCLVLFHADYLPYGSFWDTLVQLVPQIIHVNRTQPTSIFGHKINVVQHRSDVARLQAVKKFGGIYSDTDHIVLNSLDDLLNHSVVLGIENEDQNFGNGFYMGKAGAEFLDLWYDSYHSFDDQQWGEHSCIVPFKLHKKYPEVEVHVVDAFFRPNGMHIPSEFYQSHYNWTDLYGVHLYQRVYAKYFEGRIETLKSSLGEITRHVLFGDSHACFGEKSA